MAVVNAFIDQQAGDEESAQNEKEHDPETGDCVRAGLEKDQMTDNDKTGSETAKPVELRKIIELWGG